MIDCAGGVGADLETIRTVLELLAAHQIRFSIDGGLDLTLEAVLWRLQDPEAFEAWTCGGTVAQLRSWYAHDLEVPGTHPVAAAVQELGGGRGAGALLPRRRPRVRRTRGFSPPRT